MLQDIMQDSFMMKLSQATRKLNFAIMVYAVESGITVSINKGEISEAAMPENLLPYINNDKEYCSYFSHGESLVVMYFLRFTIADHNYIIIVQDNKKRTRLNKFVSMLMDALNEPPRMSSGAALEFAEQEGIISFMEMRIKELENTIKTKTEELKDRDSQLDALSTDVAKLNSKVEQNEQDAILDMTILSHEKKELESKIEELQALLKQRDAQVEKLDGTEVRELWGEAAQEEVDELRSAIDQLNIELRGIQDDLDSRRRQ